jgi:hypothetical protein
MTSSTPAFTAFLGHRRLAAGPLAEVALRAHETTQTASTEAGALLIFADEDGRQIDLDLHGDTSAVLSRVPIPDSERSHETPGLAPETTARGPGRPKLGVVAREVTLLPRHWDWLAAQPGGASVALRKLVEAARKQGTEGDRARNAREAAYRFMSAIAGNLAGFEEATRALFAGDLPGFAQRMAAWPADLRDYALRLAQAA